MVVGFTSFMARGTRYNIMWYNVCQWLATDRWFSPATLVSSTNKTDRHDIAEILLKVVLNTITLTHLTFNIQNWQNTYAWILYSYKNGPLGYKCLHLAIDKHNTPIMLLLKMLDNLIDNIFSQHYILWVRFPHVVRRCTWYNFTLNYVFQSPVAGCNCGVLNTKTAIILTVTFSTNNPGIQH